MSAACAEIMNLAQLQTAIMTAISTAEMVWAAVQARQIKSRARLLRSLPAVRWRISLQRATTALSGGRKSAQMLTPFLTARKGFIS